MLDKYEDLNLYNYVDGAEDQMVFGQKHDDGGKALIDQVN